MTQLLIEIPQNQDLDLLLALFKRLNIRFVQRTVPDKATASKTGGATLDITLAGLSADDSVEVLAHNFEKNYTAAQLTSLFTPGQSFPIWTPLDAFDASDILSNLLQTYTADE